MSKSNGLYMDQLSQADELIDEMTDALQLALEYWAHRQKRYKNRSPIWVQKAKAAIAKVTP